MVLIEILLPLYGKDGKAQPATRFHATERELMVRFGGVTTYLRAPARGKWLAEADRIERDDIVSCEVMAESVDRTWWESYRRELEERFEQEALVIRAFTIDRL